MRTPLGRPRVRRIPLGLMRGLRMRLSPVTVPDLTYFWGLAEWWDVQRALPRFVQRGMIVYNVGAHAGFLALGLARLVGPGGRVVAFEPNPDAVVRLHENIRLNDLRNITVEPAAVGDAVGEVSFAMIFNPAMGRIAGLPGIPLGTAQATVRCTTIDAYVQETGPPPAVIVIDAEAAEGLILQGTTQTLRTLRPVVILEMHEPGAWVQACRELFAAGYRLAELPGLRPIASASQISALRHYVAIPP